MKTASKNYTWKVCVLPQQNAFGRPFSSKKHEEMFCDFAKTSVFFYEIIFFNFIWPHNHIFEFHLVPKMTSKSYFWISFEKRRFTKSLGIPNEIKHFFKTKSSLILFKFLTSLKKALNYTLTAKDPKQQIWGISGGLGGLVSGGLEALGQPISDLDKYTLGV